MKSMKKIAFAAAGAAALAMAGAANAAPEMQFDINSMTVTRTAGSFDENYTGTLTWAMSGDGSTAMEAILIDGMSQSITGWTLTALTGTMIFNNGVLQAGSSFSFDMTDTGLTNSITDTYSADISMANIVASVGSPGPWTIQALTENGAFSSNSFAGINVSQWFGGQGQGGHLFGSFLKFKYNGSSTDNDVDVDIFVRAIPLPNPLTMGLAGLAGVAAIRRRRA